MTGSETRKTTRRQVLQGAAALTTASAVPSGWAIAQAKPLKVGLMLPYSGTFAKLGENITFAIELLLAEKGGKLGGREIQFIKLDDESKPETAPQNADRLVKRDQVDVLIGTVHSGVQMGIHKVVQESGTLTIVPNAGNVAVTRNLCAKNVFRSSFTNWQPAYGMGVAAAKKGYKKSVWVTWDYAAGAESGAGYKEAFEKGGGQVLPSLTLPFPQTNFQPLLAQLPGLGVDVVGSFFAGGGAVQFVKEYAAAGIKIPLCGSGFLTEGTLEAQGAAAEGIETALHYGDGLDNAKNAASARPSRTRPGATPTSMPCRATMRRSFLPWAWRRSRATSRTRPTCTRRCARRRSRARAGRSACRRRRTSRRTSTCARRRAARTRWSASPSRTWPIRAPAAG